MAFAEYGELYILNIDTLSSRIICQNATEHPEHKSVSMSFPAQPGGGVL